MTKVVYTTLEEDKINFSSKTKQQLFELYNSISEVVAIKLFQDYKYNKGIEYEDIKQMADLSLWKVINKYDLEKNIKFCTFAFAKVKYLVQDDLRVITKSRQGYAIYENSQVSLFSAIDNKNEKEIRLCDALYDTRTYSSKEQLIIDNILKVLDNSHFTERDKSIFINAAIDNIPLNKLRNRYGLSLSRISQCVKRIKKYLRQHKNTII